MPKEFEVNGQKVVFADDVSDYDIRTALIKLHRDKKSEWEASRGSETSPVMARYKDEFFAKQESRLGLIGTRKFSDLTPPEKEIVNSHIDLFERKRSELEASAQESETADDWNVFKSTLIGRQKTPYDPTGRAAKAKRNMANEFYSREAWAERYGGLSVQEIAKMAGEIDRDYERQEAVAPPAWVATTSAFGRGVVDFFNSQFGSDIEVETEWQKRTNLPSTGWFSKALEGGLQGAGYGSAIMAELMLTKGGLAALGGSRRLSSLKKIAEGIDKSRMLNTAAFSGIAASAAPEGEKLKTFVSTAAQASLGAVIEPLIGKIPIWKRMPKRLRPSYNSDGQMIPSVLNQALISGAGNVVADLATFWDPSIDERTGQGWVGRELSSEGLGQAFVTGALLGGKGQLEQQRERRLKEAEAAKKASEDAEKAREAAKRLADARLLAEEAEAKRLEAEYAKEYLAELDAVPDDPVAEQAAREFGSAKMWLQTKLGGEIEDSEVAAFLANLKSRDAAAEIADKEAAEGPVGDFYTDPVTGEERFRWAQPSREARIDEIFQQRLQFMRDLGSPEFLEGLAAEIKAAELPPNDRVIEAEAFNIDPSAKISQSDINAFNGVLDILGSPDGADPENVFITRNLRQKVDTALAYIDFRLSEIRNMQGEQTPEIAAEADRLGKNRTHLSRWSRRLNGILGVPPEMRYKSPTDTGTPKGGPPENLPGGAPLEAAPRAKAPQTPSELGKSVADLVAEGTTLSWARNVLRQAAGKLREAGRFEDSIRATALADSSEVDDIFNKRTPEANSKILSDLITKADEYAREFGLSRQKPDDGAKGESDGGEGEAEGGLGARRPKGPNGPRAPKGQVEPKGGVAEEPTSGKVTAKGGENERVGEEYTIEKNGIDGVVIDHSRAPRGTPDREYVFGRVDKDGPLAIWSRDILGSDAGPKTEWEWNGVPEVLKRLKESEQSRGIGGARAQNRPAGESFIRDYAGDSFVRDFIEKTAFGRALNKLTTRGFTLPEYLLEDVKRPSIWDNLSEDQREFIKKALELGTYDRARLAENELARRAVEWGKSRGKAGESEREDASRPGGVGRAKRGGATTDETGSEPKNTEKQFSGDMYVDDRDDYLSIRNVKTNEAPDGEIQIEEKDGKFSALILVSPKSPKVPGKSWKIENLGSRAEAIFTAADGIEKMLAGVEGKLPKTIWGWARTLKYRYGSEFEGATSSEPSRGIGGAKRAEATASKTKPGPEVIPPKSGLYDWKEVKGKMTEAERLRQAREHIERVEKAFSTAENLPGGMQSVDYEDFVAIRPKSRASMANEAPYVSISTIFKNADGTWTAHVGVIFDNWGDGWPSIKGKTRSEVIAKSAARIKQLIADNSGKIRTKAEKARMEVVLSWADGLISKYGSKSQGAQTRAPGLGRQEPVAKTPVAEAPAAKAESPAGKEAKTGLGGAPKLEAGRPVAREGLQADKWLPPGTRIATSIPRASTLAKRIYDKYLKDRYRGPEMAHSILKAVEDDGLYTNGFFAVKLLPNEAKAIAAEMKKRGMSSEGAKPLPVKNELGGSPVHGKARLIGSRLAAKGSSDPDIYVYEGEDGARLAFDASVVEEILHRYPDAKLFLGKDRMFFESGTGADKRVAVLMQRAYANLDGLPPPGPGRKPGPMFSKASRPLNLLLSDNLLTQLKSWQPKGTVDQLKKHLMKARGAKDQMYWTGLDKFLEGKETVTREEVEKFVRENQVKMDIVELTEEDAKYGRFSTQTRDNEGYFELLFRMRPPPIDEQFSFFNAHFEDSNVIAHARAKIITDSLGRRILHIDEIQSDLHQTARDRGGYRGEKEKARRIELELELGKIKSEIRTIDYDINAAYQRVSGSSESPGSAFDSWKEFKAYADQHPDLKSLLEKRQNLLLEEAKLEKEMEKIRAKPRQAPFETAEKQAELVAKTMIRLASERGLDGISLAKGIDQLDRYGTPIIAWDSMFADKSSTAKDKYVEIRIKSGAMSRSILHGGDFRDESRVATSVGEVLSENNARRILSTTPQDLVLIVRSEPELHKHLLTDGGLGHYSPERLKSLSKRLWERMQVERAGVSAPRLEGMAGTYDKTYLNSISNVFNKFGISQETVTYPGASLDRRDMPAWVFNDRLRSSSRDSLTLFSSAAGAPLSFDETVAEVSRRNEQKKAWQTWDPPESVREAVNLIADGDLKWAWARELPAENMSMLAVFANKIGVDLSIRDVRRLFDEAIRLAGDQNVDQQTLNKLKQLDKLLVAEPPDLVIKIVTGTVETNSRFLYGAYDASTDHIEISLPLVLRTMDNASLFVQAVAHEYVHAQTVRAMAEDPVVYMRFKNLLGIARRAALEMHRKGLRVANDFLTAPLVDPVELYGLSNEFELVAEAMASPSFAQFLNSIPYKGTTDQATLTGLGRIKAKGGVIESVRTLYDKFIEAVKSAMEFIGIKVSDDNLLRQVVDAYSITAPLTTEGGYYESDVGSVQERRSERINWSSESGPIMLDAREDILNREREKQAAIEDAMRDPFKAAPGVEGTQGPQMMRASGVANAVRESSPVRVSEEGALSVISWTRKMANRLAQFGGDYGRKLGNRFMAAGNFMREVSGKVSDEYERVLKASGASTKIRETLGEGIAGKLIGRRISPAMKARADMSELVREGDVARMPRWVMAVEGKNVGPLNAHEQELVDSIRSLVRKMGKQFIEAGVMRWSKKHDRYITLRDFYGGMDVPEAELGKIARRMPLIDTMDIMAAGPEHRRYWKKFVEAFQQVNPHMPPDVVEKALLDAHESYSSEPTGRVSDSFKERRAAIEHFREFREVPAAIFDGNRRVDLFETDPVRWAAGYRLHNANRLGVIKAFGQNISYDKKTFEKTDDPLPYFEIRKEYVAQGGQGYIFDQTMRAMQGQSVVQPTVDTQEIRRFVRPFVNFINSGVKGLKVSASFLYNPLEPWSTSREQAGWAEVAQAYAEGLSAGIYRLTNGRIGSADSFEIFKSLERMGAVEVQQGMFLEVSSQRFVEGVAARAMQLRVNKMIARAGAGGDEAGLRRDILRLKTMGYDGLRAERLARGRGSRAEYDALIRRAAPQATGSGLSGAERARVELSAPWRTLFPIMNFAVRHVNQISRTVKTIVDELQSSSTVDPVTGKTVIDGKKAADAAKLIIETAGVRSAHGVAQGILRAALMAGVPGLLAAWNQLQDEPGEAAYQGLVENVFGQSGPLASMYQATFRENREVTDAIFMVAVAKEIYNFIANEGRYEDLEWHDHVAEGAKWLFPLSRVALEGVPNLVSVGIFGREDVVYDIKQARRAFYNWREMEKIPHVYYERRFPTEQDEARYDAMKKARRAIADRDSPEKIVAHLEKAFSATGGKSLKSSIESARILSGLSQEQLNDLRLEIGLRNFKILQAEDRLLEELGATIRSSKSYEPPFPKREMTNILKRRGIGRGN